MSSHAKEAAAFLADEERAHWHDQALWFVRQKRDTASKNVPAWEELRETAHQIKMHTLSRLPEYLEAFETKASAKGVHVHYAKTAQDHNEAILKILNSHNVKRVVKSKSMLTEECGLNHFIEKKGIEIIDTDLGERIVQLLEEPPSHIVLPAIHRKKEEVGELFHKHLHTEKGASDPTYLTQAARKHLRERFLAGEAGITGVNFAVAETGGITIVTNEGNADLGNSLPPLHIASMGFDKIIPRAKDLAVFISLLARSATGQPITTYTSHLAGPRPGQEMHIIIVDNGRSEILQKEKFRKALCCIRCGACLNTCPVYRRTGGYSYKFVIPGPLGTVLAPHKDLKKHKSLPYACTLCESCSDICPVKVDLHQQIIEWRTEINKQGQLGLIKKAAMWGATFLFKHPKLYRTFGKLGRIFLRAMPERLLNAIPIWGKNRGLPEMPAKSFSALHKERLKQGGNDGK
ncbi:MAG: 4Fe-4S ferredoxin [Candidatus Marinimicrobia bacterium]|nr:4Fe-4S ferredoxin [Candidatus Neomarinimicrobiota bacterium]